MSDPRVENLAKILVNYSSEVKPGDWALVIGSPLAAPLVNAVQKYVLRAGANANVLTLTDETQEILLREGSTAQLEWVSPLEKLLYDKADVMIKINAASNTRAMSGIDPQKQQIYQAARRELLKTYMQRAAAGSLRWVGTQYPCHAYAQDADMSLSEYEDFVYGATFADQSDPIQRWLDVRQKQQHWVDWLKGKKRVRVRGPHIDLSLSIEGRSFINSDGKKNMPSGEIFTGPVEDSVNGWVKFSYPAIRGGREVEGVEFTFEAGKVVQAKASKNQDYLLSQLDLDEGARYLGEFAIGTNYGIKRFTKSILFDEKIGGTIHMAVGAGYPETGSHNQSAVHWDFICDMRQDSEILVDGELFYKNGEFQV